MQQRKKHKKIGKTLAWTGILLLIALGFIQFLAMMPKPLIKSVQTSVRRIDREMQSLIEAGMNRADLEKHELGLFVFTNDSLTYWNRNELYPRMLKRRITTGRDTICHIASGDYFIKSYETESSSYYLFKLLNTNYRIENQYFENNFKPLSKFLDLNLSFDPTQGDFDLLNQQGKLLSKCSLTGKPQLKSPYKYWYYPIGALIIIGCFIAYRKPQRRKNKQRKNRLHVKTDIGIIALFSIIGTYFYTQFENKKENQRMAKMAEKLLDKRDEAFEASYADFADALSADTSFRVMLFAESNVLADVVLGYSKELLFDETMKAYNATLTLCEPGEEITIQPEGYVADCEDYFYEILAHNEQRQVGNGLYFIDYYTLDPNYLAKIKIISEDSLQQKTLYFEFYKPIAPESFGFPQLLQEDHSNRPYDYSVANYRDQILMYKYGRYIYPNFFKEQNGTDHDFNHAQGYKHYTISYGHSNALVISTPKKTWLEKTSPFAIFFLSMTLPYLLIYWVLRPKENKKRRSFAQRLQRVLMITLGLSFLVIGPVSIIYMRSLYNQKTMTSQFETTQTLSMEMKNDLNLANMAANASRETWTETLQHYASTFFTDMNLYRLDGTLTATTRPEIYELNLQAPIMNAEAYQQMHRNKALFFRHKEHLGKGDYESTYIPLTDAEGNTLAYLNTPYFSSATDLHREIKNFVLTYINIILVLLAIAVTLVLKITKRLTKPLGLIQSKMRDIKIDEKNEPIEWSGDDEIGVMVGRLTSVDSSFLYPATMYFAGISGSASYESACEEYAKFVNRN